MNAYCGRHRIPAGLNGCPRCLEEAQEHERAAETAAFWGDLVRRAAYLLVPAVLLTIAWNVARRPVPAPAKLDAASYRPVIQAIEAALYTTEAFSEADAHTVHRESARLTGLVREAPPSDAQRRAVYELDIFYATYGKTVDGTLDRAAARRDWEKLRGIVFAEAPWLRHLDDGLEAAPSSAGVGAPADAVHYAASIETISNAVNRVRVNLGLWPDAPDVQDPETRGRWETAQRDFEADLASIRNGLPAAPADAGAAWTVAYDDLKKAVQVTQRVPLARYDRPAPSHILEARYRAVENALNNARASLRLAQGGL